MPGEEGIVQPPTLHLHNLWLGDPERKGATCLLSTIQRPVLEWGRKWRSLTVLSECGLIPKPWRENSCEEGPEDKLAEAREAPRAA